MHRAACSEMLDNIVPGGSSQPSHDRLCLKCMGLFGQDTQCPSTPLGLAQVISFCPTHSNLIPLLRRRCLRVGTYSAPPNAQFEEMYEQKRKEVNKAAEKFEKQLKAAKKSGSKANTDKARQHCASRT